MRRGILLAKRRGRPAATGGSVARDGLPYRCRAGTDLHRDVLALPGRHQPPAHGQLQLRCFGVVADQLIGQPFDLSVGEAKVAERRMHGRSINKANALLVWDGLQHRASSSRFSASDHTAL